MQQIRNAPREEEVERFEISSAVFLCVLLSLFMPSPAVAGPEVSFFVVCLCAYINPSVMLLL